MGTLPLQGKRTEAPGRDDSTILMVSRYLKKPIDAPPMLLFFSRKVGS